MQGNLAMNHTTTEGTSYDGIQLAFSDGDTSIPADATALVIVPNKDRAELWWIGRIVELQRYYTENRPGEGALMFQAKIPRAVGYEAKVEEANASFQVLQGYAQALKHEVSDSKTSDDRRAAVLDMLKKAASMLVDTNSEPAPN